MSTVYQTQRHVALQQEALTGLPRRQGPLHIPRVTARGRELRFAGRTPGNGHLRAGTSSGKGDPNKNVLLVS